jgi:pyruvate/2-oxoglutarate dehydrogenase complex dihydrolipoamide acyltransferase (E2) component
MQGTVVKVAVADGDVVEAGDLVVMIEAVKMEQPLNAHLAGTITGLTATDGLIIKSGEGRSAQLSPIPGPPKDAARTAGGTPSTIKCHVRQ